MAAMWRLAVGLSHGGAVAVWFLKLGGASPSVADFAWNSGSQQLALSWVTVQQLV